MFISNKLKGLVVPIPTFAVLKYILLFKVVHWVGDTKSILFVLFINCAELNIPMRSVEAYVAPIVIGLTAVFIAIPVPAMKFVVITGDNVALPVVIANPLPTVTLFVRLKYGILLRPEPEPLNDVAVTVNGTVNPDEFIVNLSVSVPDNDEIILKSPL